MSAEGSRSQITIIPVYGNNRNVILFAEFRDQNDGHVAERVTQTRYLDKIEVHNNGGPCLWLIFPHLLFDFQLTLIPAKEHNNTNFTVSFSSLLSSGQST